MAKTVEINSPVIAIIGIFFIVTVMGGLMYLVNGKLDWISYTMLGIVALALSFYVFRNIGPATKSQQPQQPQQFQQYPYMQQGYRQYPPRYPPMR